MRRRIIAAILLVFGVSGGAAAAVFYANGWRGASDWLAIPLIVLNILILMYYTDFLPRNFRNTFIARALLVFLLLSGLAGIYCYSCEWQWYYYLLLLPLLIFPVSFLLKRLPGSN